MATYALINLIFIVPAVVLLIVYRRRIMVWPWLATLGLLVVLTAIFDSLIIHFGIVAYDESLIAGLYLWLAPIEDFAYSLVVCMTIPVIWKLLTTKKSLQT